MLVQQDASVDSKCFPPLFASGSADAAAAKDTSPLDDGDAGYGRSATCRSPARLT